MKFTTGDLSQEYENLDIVFGEGFDRAKYVNYKDDMHVDNPMYANLGAAIADAQDNAAEAAEKLEADYIINVNISVHKDMMTAVLAYVDKAQYPAYFVVLTGTAVKLK